MKQNIRLHNKLVRDNIVAHLTARGITCEWSTLDDKTYGQALRDKLTEEVAEFFAAPADGDEWLEELADVLEVIHALCAYKGVSVEQLEAVRAQKAAKLGGFVHKVYLKTTREVK